MNKHHLQSVKLKEELKIVATIMSWYGTLLLRGILITGGGQYLKRVREIGKEEEKKVEKSVPH